MGRSVPCTCKHATEWARGRAGLSIARNLCLRLPPCVRPQDAEYFENKRKRNNDRGVGRSNGRPSPLPAKAAPPRVAKTSNGNGVHAVGEEAEEDPLMGALEEEEEEEEPGAVFAGVLEFLCSWACA